jgi:hypothetical protein
MPMPRRQAVVAMTLGGAACWPQYRAAPRVGEAAAFHHLPDDPHIVAVAHRASRLLSNPELSMRFWSYYQ